MRLLAPLILGVVVFTGVAHSAAKLKLLPKPRPALDIDRTILFHQADAVRSSEATVMLIGDSSCLMNVSARELGQRLAQSVVNVGTFSYLGLADYAKLLRAPRGTNSRRTETVILLMHPEALRRPAPDERYGRILSNYLEGIDHCEGASFYRRLSCGLGLEIVRTRIIAPLLPSPLPGKFGELYAFTSELERHLSEQGGSLVDPDPKPFSGNAEYRLADSLEAQSRTFRASLPAGTKLVAGITPVPETFAPAGYAEQYQQMLKQWGEWLQSDRVLTNLPPILPDRLFSKVTHLNRDGISVYTAELAKTIPSNSQ